MNRTASDPYTSRARPTFLYVMYALLLWSLPIGLVAAIRPETAAAIARGMAAYLNAIPEPLYALFATGYLGYTVARTWEGRGRSRTPDHAPHGRIPVARPRVDPTSPA